ncbi:hypothetical protein JXM83_03835 [Candidatus Woesearchaeota archaeon]|nr:hypothetical protein [Candidatus Woesearchaeota archaeon]
MLFHKRVESHILEKVVVSFMVLFGFISVYIFLRATSIMKATGETINPFVAVIEVLMIVLIAIFANIWISIKIYEQHRP